MLEALSIKHLFENNVKKFPARMAVRHSADSLSYENLNKKSNQFAHYLLENGIKSGDFVSILAEKSINLLVAIIGILKAGAAFIPIHPQSQDIAVNSILKNANCRWLITDKNSRFDKTVTKMALSNLSSLVNQYPDVDIRVTTDNDHAYAIYTSGTTGAPKGVIVTHHNLIHTYYSWENIYQLSPNDVHLQMANVSFDVFIGDMLRALGSGAELVLCDKETLLHPEKLYRLIQEAKVNCAEFVPAVLRTLLAYVIDNNLLFNQFRLLLCGSDVWSMKEYRQVKKICGDNTRVISSYGLTEATIDSTWFEEHDERLNDNQNVPIGQPFSHVHLYLLDENRIQVKTGEIGEIYIGGHGVAKGYMGQETLTRERFVPNPFQSGTMIYKTGDYGRVLADGTIEFLGRNQTHMKIHGNRVELLALEALLNDHPSIEACIAYPRCSDRGGVQLECMVLAKEPVLRYEEFVEYITKNLPCYYVPQKIYLMDKICLTQNGKVDRDPERQSVIGEIHRAIIPLKDEHEHSIAEVWQDILKVEKIGRTCNFYELGGTSLQFVSMLNQLKETFNIEFSYCDASPVIKDLSNQIQISLKQMFMQPYMDNDKESHHYED